MSHQATTPDVVHEYFKARGVEHSTYQTHPLITEYFIPGKGWVRETGRQRVSYSKIRKLKKLGATTVQITAGGRSPDFSVAEILRKTRHPLLGGSLIGSRTWPAK